MEESKHSRLHGAAIGGRSTGREDAEPKKYRRAAPRLFMPGVGRVRIRSAVPVVGCTPITGVVTGFVLSILGLAFVVYTATCNRSTGGSAGVEESKEQKRIFTRIEALTLTQIPKSPGKPHLCQHDAGNTPTILLR